MAETLPVYPAEHVQPAGMLAPWEKVGQGAGVQAPVKKGVVVLGTMVPE